MSRDALVDGGLRARNRRVLGILLAMAGALALAALLVGVRW
jgi:hypothetical protein